MTMYGILWIPLRVQLFEYLNNNDIHLNLRV